MLEDRPGLVPPTHFSAPEYYKTFGPEVADLCREAGYRPDPQQELALDLIFARRADGLSAAFETALIVGRQNLKSGTFKMCQLGWLYLFHERLVIYSAHEFITAMEMFRDMEELVKNCDFLRKEVRRVIRNHGEEAIELLTGARVLFKTRTKGGGRGLSGRKVILDEAYAVKPEHMGALVPTLSAQPDPQLLHGSAAGLAGSAVLRELRDRGRDGKDPRQAYLEWCAPDPATACDAGKACTHSKTAEGCGCDKPDMWLKANPAIGRRISLDYVAAERRALPVGEFCRERMGWWDDPLEGAAAFTSGQWVQCGDRKSTPAAGSPLAVAIAVSPDRGMSAIGLAGYRDDGQPHIELVEFLPGTGWLMDRLAGIMGRRNPVVLVLDPATHAGAFEKGLRAKDDTGGGEFITKNPNSDKPLTLNPGQRLMHLVTRREYVQACGQLTHQVTQDIMRHPDQAPLNSAVEQSVADADAAGGFVWQAKPGYDITPLNVATLAGLGLTMYGKKKPPKPFFLTG